MSSRADLARVVAVLLFMAGLGPGCGGKVLGGNGGGGGAGDDSGANTMDSGTGIDSSTDGSSACIDLEVFPSDLSCGSDQDCALVRTGEVCNGQCSCGDVPVNAAAAARFQSDTASLTLEGCPCFLPGDARCLGGQCTLCGFDPDQPAGCADAGGTTVEDGGIEVVDGGEFDTGISDADGSSCVDIELSTYDRSCNQASDCILIQTGKVCSGQCSCGGQPVSASEQSRYAQATSGVAFGACACPLEVAPSCLENSCEFPVVLPVDP